MVKRQPDGKFRKVSAEERDTAERFTKWQTRVARARELRDRWSQDYDVDEGELVFLNRKHQRALVNLVAATVKTARPNMFFQSPTFYVRPKPGRQSPVAERITRVGEGVLAAIATQNDNLERAGRLALLQAFFRLGVLKIIYDPRMEPNPKRGEPVYQTQGGEPVLDPATGGWKALVNPLTGEPVVEPDEVMTDEVYRWEWVDAANLLLPDEGPDPCKWTWLGEEVVVPLEDAKDDSRFPATIRERLQANKTNSRLRGSRGYARKTSGEQEELFEYVEVYDLKAKRLLIWADGQTQDEFLHDDLVPDWVDDHPYGLLLLGEPILGPEPCPWPVPVVRDWLGPNEEYNIRRQQTTQGAKRSARKVLFEDQAFPDEEEARRALQSPDDMTAVRVNAGYLDKVRPLEERDLNPSIYKDLPLALNDFRMMAGTTGARQADPDADTATEATLVERSANLRDSDALAAVTKWLSEAGRKMFQCVKATLTLGLWTQMQEMDDKELLGYVQRVYGLPPEAVAVFPGLKEAVRARFGENKWIHVTRSQLQFEADVTIVPGSTRPRSLDIERRQWLEFLRIVGGAPQLALSRKLLEYTADKFDLHDDALLDELNALAQQMIQVNANQAGRTGGASGNGAAPAAQAILSAVTGGSR